MDKHEYKMCADEIKSLISRKKYNDAMKLSDTVDWSRVKNVGMLCTVSDLYKLGKRFEDSRNIMFMAYERHPGDRMIVYSLCELSIKLGDVVSAVEYYKEFVQSSPNDNRKYILQYKLYEAQEVTLEERIEVLKNYKGVERREKWIYELAYLYHRIGFETQCIEECDDLFLWFGSGKYVRKALELKMLHTNLTPEQQAFYDGKPQQKSRTYYDEQPGEYEDEASFDNYSDFGKYEQNPPLQDSYDDEDMLVAPVNVGKYATINLQRELAEQIQEVMSTEEGSGTSQINGGGRYTEGYGDTSDQNYTSDYGDTSADQGSTYVNRRNSKTRAGDYDPYNDEYYEDDRYNTTGDPFYGESQYEDDMAYQDEMEQDYNSRLINNSKRTGMLEKPDEIRVSKTHPYKNNKNLSDTDKIRQFESDLGNTTEFKQFESYQNSGIIPPLNEVGDDSEPIKLSSKRRVNSGSGYNTDYDENEFYDIDGEEMIEASYGKGTIIPPGSAGKVGETTGNIIDRMMDDSRGAVPTSSIREITLPDDPEEEEEVEPVVVQMSTGRIPKIVDGEGYKTSSENIGQNTASIVISADDNVYGGMNQSSYQGKSQGDYADQAPYQGQSRGDYADQVSYQGQSRGDYRNQSPYQGQSRGDYGNQVPQQNRPLDNYREQPQNIPPVRQQYPTAEEMARQGDENYDKLLAQDSDGQISMALDRPEESEVERQMTGQISIAETLRSWEEKKRMVRERQEAQMQKNIEKITGDLFEGYDKNARKELMEDLGAYSEKAIHNEIGKRRVDVMDSEKRSNGVRPAKEPGDNGRAPLRQKLGYGEEKPQSDSKREENTQTRVPSALKPQNNTNIPNSYQDSRYAQQDPNVPRKAPLDVTSLTKGGVPTDTSVLLTRAREVVEGRAPMENAAVSKVIEPFKDAYYDPAKEAAQMDAAINAVAKAAEAANARKLDSHTAQIEVDDDDVPFYEDAMGSPMTEGDSDASELSEDGDGLDRTTGDRGGRRGSYGDEYEDSNEGRQRRTLTVGEKKLFGPFIQTKGTLNQILDAVDHVSLASYTGNIILTGERDMGTLKLCRALVKEISSNDSNFSGNVAKITGDALNRKDIARTFSKLSNGALIVEGAGQLDEDTVYEIVSNLDREEQGIVVILEDTRINMNKLLNSYEALYNPFNLRIDLEAMDNDSLVNFAKRYAQDRGYSIDEMGVLELYTRISDLQTSEHTVTTRDVKRIVDEAIDRADKRKLTHLVDIVMGKRYDEEDMVILRAKDFVRN